jgi:hypothetical protein
VTQVVKPARKKTEAAPVSLRLDASQREQLNERAKRSNTTVQHMLRSLVEDLLNGRSCFINPLGQVFVRDARGGSPRMVADAAGPVAPLSESGTGPRA